MIISVIRNGLNLLNVSSFIQQIVIGVVIILAVLIDRLKYGQGLNPKSFFKKHAILLTVLLILAVSGLVFTGIRSRARARIPKICSIMKTLNNPFFIDMAEGAKKGIKEHPEYRLIIQAPEREVDVEQQVRYMENMIVNKVKVICITPSGSKEVLSGLALANRAGIPVIVIDTRLDEELVKKRNVKYAAFNGSDNYEGGEIAAQFMAKKLNGKGKIAVLEGIAGAQTSDLRKQGFMDVIKHYPGIKVVASQTADWERGKGFDVTQNILQAHRDIHGIFACNDLMALGAVAAVEQAEMKGKVIIVGFDATEDAQKAILQGKMAGSVAQYPALMGEEAVKYAVKIIQGEEIPKEIKIKIEMLTKEMLENDEYGKKNSRSKNREN